MTKPIVDAELRAWLPALTADERTMLEDELKKHGCKDTIKVWKREGQWLIVDGMNRYEICEANHIDFRTSEMRFADITAVKAWMIVNQIARRNLSVEKRAYLAAEMYNLIKKPRGGDQKSKYQSDTLIGDAAGEVAAIFQTSPANVKRAEPFRRGVDEIGEKIGEEAKAKILSGKSKAAMADVPALAAIAAKRPDDVRAVIDGQKKAKDVIKKKSPPEPRPMPAMPKGRQATQRELRAMLRDMGACALTSLSDISDKNALSIIGEQIGKSNTRTVSQAIAVLIEEWPADGVSFFVGTVESLKGKGNGRAKSSIGLQPTPGKYANRGHRAEET